MSSERPFAESFKPLLSIAAAILVSAHVALLVVGCDSGGGSGPDGNSTIQGTVDSFSAGGAFYMPREKESRLMELARHVMNLVVPEAKAAVQGVTVRLEGTDLSGTTDDRGFFIISGAPGGDRELTFSYNGQSAALPVNVPDNGVVTLDRVRVNNGSVGVGRVSVVQAPSDNSNDNQAGNANANANANTNTNTNQNTNTNRNDNGDDDNVNSNSNSNGNTNQNANDNDDDDDNDNDDDDDDNRNGNGR